MHRIVPLSACATALLLLLSAPLDAQMRSAPHERAASIELRGGYGYPLGNFSDDVGAEPDFGFGVTGSLMLTPSVGLYTGWSRDIFDCEACAGGDQINVSGFEGGLTFVIPVRHGFTPWLRAGATWHRTSFEFDVADFRADREWGFQAAGGLDIPLGEMFSISPGVRYNTLSPSVDFPDDSPIDVDAGTVQYLSFDLGLKFHIPRR